MAAEPITLGVDGAFALPMGDWSDATGPMIGALLRLEYPATPALAITGRIGYLYGLKKSTGDWKYGVNDIPIWGGIKYYFNGVPDGLYVAPELGLNFLSVSVEGPGGWDGSDSETKLGVNLGAGYKAGALDFRGGLSMFDIDHAGDSMALFANVGYNFTSF